MSAFTAEDDPRVELYDDLVAQLPWRDQAACLELDPDIFFPSRGESVEPARAVCSSCPVRDECGEYAITRVVREGIFGGLSERQRRHIRHLRRCSKATTCRHPAHHEVEDPAPGWVAPEYWALWHRKRARRRATFGDGTLQSKRIARQLARAAATSSVA